MWKFCFRIVCVCVCVCTHASAHVHWRKCVCELSELAGREMEEWTLNTWKSLCKVQRSWGSRSTDILANGPGISPVEQAVRVNRHVSVNVDPWAERWGRQKAPGGSPGGCQGSEKQSGPDSQAQKRGYAQPLRHLTFVWNAVIHIASFMQSTKYYLLSGGSAAIESVCNVGNLGLILELGKIPWRRERPSPPVFWPEGFHGLYSLWGHKQSDTTERPHFTLL